MDEDEASGRGSVQHGYEQRAHSKDQYQGTGLDAEIWGTLQHHVPLEMVHEKLPLKDFFRLSAVSKDWLRVASHRLEPKPYFVTITLACEDRYLNGIMSLDVIAGEFRWKPQHYVLQHFRFFDHFNDVYFHPPFAVEGLVFSHYPDDLEQRAVFNLHSKTWHVLPHPTPRMKMQRVAWGMVVDTSERPYSFKLVVGSNIMLTRIYDSKSRTWSKRLSRLDQRGKDSITYALYATCLCSTNGCLYISREKHRVIVYSMDSDVWTTLQGPPVVGVETQDHNTYALGEWEGRIFTARENSVDTSISVWELQSNVANHPNGPQWVEYARTEDRGYVTWLSVVRRTMGSHLRLVTCFCMNYLLIYYCDVTRGFGVLPFDLATREWKYYYPMIRRDSVLRN